MSDAGFRRFWLGGIWEVSGRGYGERDRGVVVAARLAKRGLLMDVEDVVVVG